MNWQDGSIAICKGFTMRIPTLLHTVNAGATHSYLRLWVTNLLALGLVACGGGVNDEVTGTKDPLASYRQQVVTWSACDFGNYQELSSLPPIAAVISEMQCTKIRVPTDYTNPQGQVLEIGVSRVKATPSAFKPELFFFNPGGPGGDVMRCQPFLHRSGRLIRRTMRFRLRKSSNCVNALM